jgi:hypothetical protein
MHARELAELAALVAVHSPSIVAGGGRIPLAANQQYWTAAKCRLDRWLRLLRQLAIAADAPLRPATLAWPRVAPVLEEIFVGELLTRVWTAAAAAYDAVHTEQELEPVARNILAGHLDARRRLLALMAEGRAIELPEAVHLNQLRRRIERWTDLLLAHLAAATDVGELAFDSARARDFAEDLAHEAAHADRRLTSQILLAALDASLGATLSDRSPNADLNRRIGSAILAAFREQQFDSLGVSKSLWLEQLSRTASDTEGMLVELLQLDGDSGVRRWRA